MAWSRPRLPGLQVGQLTTVTAPPRWSPRSAMWRAGRPMPSGPKASGKSAGSTLFPASHSLWLVGSSPERVLTGDRTTEHTWADMRPGIRPGWVRSCRSVACGGHAVIGLGIRVSAEKPLTRPFLPRYAVPTPSMQAERATPSLPTGAKRRPEGISQCRRKAARFAARPGRSRRPTSQRTVIRRAGPHTPEGPDAAGGGNPKIARSVARPASPPQRQDRPSA